MGFFSSSRSDVRYGALVDIGSGSVLVAVVASDPNLKQPTIIWTKREYTPLRHTKSVNDSAKSVMTSLVNALMLLDSEGRKALRESVPEASIENLQITIAAPWSYTVTKTISYQSEEATEVSRELISELLRTAEQKVEEEMHENEKAHDLGLNIIARTTLAVLANDYPVIITGKQKATSVKIVQASAVAQNYLSKALFDARNKMFPKATFSDYSFILPYFIVMNEVLSGVTNEYCLVDITYEATEIGVVRDGILTHTTHIPFGAFSIAREISEALGVPLEEAYGYLTCEDMTCFVGTEDDKKKGELEAILQAYEDRLTDLFKQTGDTLSIPKKIYIHGNLATEPFFNSRILAAAAKATKMHHAVYNVTSELLTKYFKDDASELKDHKYDTALLISALFFHNETYHKQFDDI
jgi:hypothetical protein